MQQTEAGPSTSLPAAFVGRARASSNRMKELRNGFQPSPAPIDPLIEGLDEREEVEVWLNEVVAARRGHHSDGTGISALHLRVEPDGHASATSSSSSSSFSSLTHLESQLASILSTLSFARQDTMAIVDSTISEVNTAIPRLSLELRLMRDAALTLKGSIDNLRLISSQAKSTSDRSTSTGQQVATTSGSTASAALERLAALSTLHSRMSSARDVLGLAESWSTLAADITSSFNEAKFQRASSRLAEAQKSLSVFERTPEYEGRKRLLEGLCDSLVNNVAPSLEKAAKEKDLQESLRLSGIFRGVGRDVDFAQRWREARLQPWLSEWKAVCSSVRDSGGFGEALPVLISSLLILLNEEKQFAPTLFPANPRQSMEISVATAFQRLDPGLGSVLREAIRSEDKSAILALVEIHACLKEAVASISNVLNSVESYQDGLAKSPLLSASVQVYQHSPGAISPTTENKQLVQASPTIQFPNTTRPRQASHHRKNSSRRLSASLSIPNGKATGSSSDVFDDHSPRGSIYVKPSGIDALLNQLPPPAEWEAVLLDPLVEWQSNGIQLERAYLETFLQAGPSVEVQRDNEALLGSELGKMLQDNHERMKRLTKEACRRSVSLTFGLVGDELVSCIEEILVTNLDGFHRTLKSRSSQVVNYARRQASERQGLDGEDMQQASSAAEDNQWTAFEESVILLSSLRKIEQSIEDSERIFADELKDTAEMLLNPPASASNEAILRLCGHNASSHAPLAILARHFQARLHSSRILSVLEAVRHTAREGRTQAGPAIILDARLCLLKQVKSVQQHLIDITLAPLLAHMEAYTQLSIWNASRLPGSVNEYELAMPTFSLSPTEEMSRIGEGLLNLPRLLEVWSDNADLRWAIQGLPYASATGDGHSTSLGADKARQNADDTSTSPTQSNKRMSFQTSANSTSPTLDRRLNLHRHSSSVAAIATQVPDSASPSSVQVEANDNAAVLQMYLTSIALSLVSNLVSLVLPSISKLSQAGSSQLVADLEYLLNILAALNVNSAAITAITSLSNSSNQAVLLIRTLEAWKDSCRLKDADGKRIVSHVRNGHMARGIDLMPGIEGYEDDVDRLVSLMGTQAFDMVARLRGW